MARVRPPQGGFRIDPYAPAVYALEEFDPVGQRAAKAAICRERVIAPRAPRLGADTPADALAICLDTHGEARLAQIARLLGTSEDDARQRLGTLVFDDPESGRLVPAAEYLSGNVRAKLRTAEQAAEDDPRFAVNAAGLRNVIPADITPGEIDARLGAAWIGSRYVELFLRETLDDPRLRAEHPGGQIWAIRGNSHSILATSTWGTGRYPAPQLAQAILEQRKIEVRDLVQTPDGDRTVLNLDATLAAQEKAAELAERFSEWAWEDPARAADLARAYNEKFNSLVLRGYDDASAVAARARGDLPAAPPPGRRGRPDDPRARGAARPRSRRRQDSRNDHRDYGATAPGPGPQAGHRRAEPHAGAVRPRMAPALPPGARARRAPRGSPGRPAPPVRRPLRDGQLGRHRHITVGLRADPAERHRAGRVPGPPARPDAPVDRKRQDGRQAHRQAPRRRAAAGRGTAESQARLRQGPGDHVRGDRHRLPLRRRGTRVQEPANPIEYQQTRPSTGRCGPPTWT